MATTKKITQRVAKKKVASTKKKVTKKVPAKKTSVKKVRTSVSKKGTEIDEWNRHGVNLQKGCGAGAPEIRPGDFLSNYCGG